MKRKIYILVTSFGCIPQDAKMFLNEEESITAWKDYMGDKTGEKYEDYLKGELEMDKEEARIFQQEIDI